MTPGVFTYTCKSILNWMFVCMYVYVCMYACMYVYMRYADMYSTSWNQIYSACSLSSRYTEIT